MGHRYQRQTQTSTEAKHDAAGTNMYEQAEPSNSDQLAVIGGTMSDVGDSGAGDITDLLNTMTGLDALGSGPNGNALSILTGINTAVQHESAQDGAGEYIEKGVMGTTDAIWGLAGGVPAAIDAVTGGNTGGLFKAVAGAGIEAYDTTGELLDAAWTGDWDNIDKDNSLDNYWGKVTEGDYGCASAGIGLVLDGAFQGADMLWNGDYDREMDTTHMENFSDNLTSGSEFNPMTHLGRAGESLGEGLYDLLN